MTDFLYMIIIFPIVQILELVFAFSQQIFTNTTGISIIVISGVVSVLCLPVYTIAEKWQERERETAKRMKPKIDKIRAVFSSDERFMMLNTYYRQQHYHPLFALRGTFGVLFQVPFFIAAYSWLSHLEALKGASFWFIHDLSKPDSLVPLAGGINLLPLLMTAINVIAGAVYTRGFPLKDKLQLYGIAAVFLLLLYNSPAGLVFYWTLNNLFSLLKNFYFKIKAKRKRVILYILLSILLIAIIYMLLFVVRPNRFYRHVLASLCGMLLGIFWISLLVKKIFPGLSAKLPQIAITQKNMFRLFLISCCALWALLGWYIPSTLIAASPQEFSFIDHYTTPLTFISTAALQAFGFCVLWPICLYMLFAAAIQKRFAIVFMFLFISALCNSFLYPGNYGLISITLEFSRGVDYDTREIINNFLVLFVFLIMTFFLLYIKYAGKIIVFFILCTAALLSVSIVNIVRIQNEYTELAKYYKPEKKEDMKIEPIFHLSKTGKNVVVIMLDMGISGFIPYIFDESPELKDIYSGFVYYPNSVSFNGYTRLGAPPIFGGYEATPLEINKRPNVTLTRKHNEALMMMPRLFSEAGYSVTVTDPPYVNFNWISNTSIYDTLPGVKAYITDSHYTNVWMKEHDFKLPPVSSILRRGIIWYGFFRMSPVALREGLYFKGNWCAPITNRSLKLTLNGYCVLDYLPRLTDFSVDTENTALLFVNNTTHEKSLLQAPEYRPVLNVTDYGTSPFKKEAAYHVNAASVKRLAEWFEYLKTEEVYDNTRIVIVSDHGALNTNYTIKKSGLPFPVEQFNPMLLVKDFNAYGEIKTSKTFMSTADVPTLSLNGLFDNPVNPYTGSAITDSLKNEPLYIVINRGEELGRGQAKLLKLNPKEDYYVHTNIFDEKNWKKADSLK